MLGSKTLNGYKNNSRYLTTTKKDLQVKQYSNKNTFKEIIVFFTLNNYNKSNLQLIYYN